MKNIREENDIGALQLLIKDLHNKTDKSLSLLAHTAIQRESVISNTFVKKTYHSLIPSRSAITHIWDDATPNGYFRYKNAFPINHESLHFA
ncbi:MAG: hypothetical protein K6F30_11450, partial [Lachnospiraceae bacterium]|nr:hypothetical protein [Lachnospiraceae bacterium]